MYCGEAAEERGSDPVLVRVQRRVRRVHECVKMDIAGLAWDSRMDIVIVLRREVARVQVGISDDPVLRVDHGLIMRRGNVITVVAAGGGTRRVVGGRSVLGEHVAANRVDHVPQGALFGFAQSCA